MRVAATASSGVNEKFSYTRIYYSCDGYRGNLTVKFHGSFTVSSQLFRAYFSPLTLFQAKNTAASSGPTVVQHTTVYDTK